MSAATSLGYGLGYVPSPPDTRDHDAMKVVHVKSAPPSVPRSPYVITLDQGGLGSCTCNAAAQAIRVAQIIQLVDAGVMTLEQALAEVEFLARLFPYYLSRAVTHETGVDAGTYIRLVFKVLCQFGFPPESAWTYSDNADPKDGKFAKMPNRNAFRLAYDQHQAANDVGEAVVKYSRILSTGAARVEDVKRAIAARHLVVFGTDVSKGFCADMSGNGGKPIDPPATNGKDTAGGHAMVGGGYTAKGMDTLNSWSKDFGEDGWCVLSWDYVADKRTNDLWIAERAPILARAA